MRHARTVLPHYLCASAIGVTTCPRRHNAQTPIFWATSPEMVRALVTTGAKVDVRNTDSETPLHHCKSPNVAAELLDYGCNPNAKNKVIHIQHEIDSHVAPAQAVY